MNCEVSPDDFEFVPFFVEMNEVRDRNVFDILFNDGDDCVYTSTPKPFYTVLIMYMEIIRKNSYKIKDNV